MVAGARTTTKKKEKKEPERFLWVHTIARSGACRALFLGCVLVGMACPVNVVTAWACTCSTLATLLVGGDADKENGAGKEAKEHGCCGASHDDGVFLWTYLCVRTTQKARRKRYTRFSTQG